MPDALGTGSYVKDRLLFVQKLGNELFQLCMVKGIQDSLLFIHRDTGAHKNAIEALPRA